MQSHLPTYNNNYSLWVSVQHFKKIHKINKKGVRINLTKVSGENRQRYNNSNYTYHFHKTTTTKQFIIQMEMQQLLQQICMWYGVFGIKCILMIVHDSSSSLKRTPFQHKTVMVPLRTWSHCTEVLPNSNIHVSMIMTSSTQTIIQSSTSNLKIYT